MTMIEQDNMQLRARAIDQALAMYAMSGNASAERLVEAAATIADFVFNGVNRGKSQGQALGEPVAAAA